MRRRRFLLVLGGVLGGAAIWPFAAEAQQSEPLRRLGILMAYRENDAEAQNYVSVFQSALEGLGWVEGSNLSFRRYWPAPEVAAIDEAAKQLIEWQPDVILSSSTPTTTALLHETRTIPVVFTIVSDPVGSKFVNTFARPGGNATGFTNLEASMGGKWLELLKEIAPDVHDVGVLFNPATATYTDFYMQGFTGAGAALGIDVRAEPVASDEDIQMIFARRGRTAHSGIVVMTDSYTSSHRTTIIRAAAENRIPVVYPFRFFAEEGGLLAYGSNRIEPFRGAASYVNRILRGERPGDLPVQAPTQFELVVNTRTASALGLTVPLTLLGQADEIIE